MKISDVSAALQSQQLVQEKTEIDDKVKRFQTVIEQAKQRQDMTELNKVAADFEQIFVGMLLKSMRATVAEGGLIDKSMQEKMFEGMLDEEYAKQLSAAGGIGISTLIVNQLQQYIDSDENSTQYFDGKA